MSLVGSEGGGYANAKRHREKYDFISGYPIARCVVVRSKASAPYPLDTQDLDENWAEIADRFAEDSSHYD